jgi:hypothetical protein
VLKKLTQSLASSTVDLNPHQIKAALFAFNSPLSRGAILCDEVGERWEALFNDLCEKMMTVTAFECENIKHEMPPADLSDSTLRTFTDKLLKEIGLRN